MTGVSEDRPACCGACGTEELEEHYPGLYKCRACTHVQADLKISNEELARLYARDYFFGEEYSDYVSDKPVLQRNFSSRLRVLRRFLNPQRHRRLLEVGCAYGLFLELAKGQFDIAKGIDISTDGVRYAKEHNLDAVEGDLLQHRMDEQEFDVVCLWDAIEHLRDPGAYLRKIGELTKPGALLAFTTGDIASLNARLKGRRWRLIHPPTHLHYYTRKSMEAAMARAGFKVVHFEHCGFYRSVELVSHTLFTLRRPTLGFLHKLIMKSGLGRRMFYTNLYDIMYVIASRE